MKYRTTFCVLSAMTLFTALSVIAQDIKIGVTYVCNGEQLIVTGCNIDSQADSAHCQVEYPDRPPRVTPAGKFPVYQSTTRGELRKLLPACKQPSAQELQQRENFEKGIQAAQQEAVAQQQAYRQAHEAQQPGDTTDPGTLAARRCAAAGGSLLECAGKGMSKSLDSLPPGMNPFHGKVAPAGLRMNGFYRASRGFEIGFTTGSAYDPGYAGPHCGNLMSATGPYTVALKNGEVLVTVPNQPKPITLALRSDGVLVGPESVEVTGEVIVGYSKSGAGPAVAQNTPPQQWQTKQITASEARWEYSANEVQQGGGGQLYVTVPASQGTWLQPATSTPVISGPTPIYKSKTETCSAGRFNPTGPSLQGPNGVSGSLSNLSGSPAKKTPVPAGLRLVGNYEGGSGVQLEFHPNVAVLDCGEVEVAKSYDVENNGKQVLIRIKDDAAPILLSYQPDGSLLGPEQVRINGRVFVGKNAAGQLAFAPKAVSCSMRVLRATSK